MRFFCHCLNISINLLNIGDDQQTLTEFLPVDLVPIVNNVHEWLPGHVSGEQSIQIMWPSLVQTLPVREMKLNRCLNCHFYTHAISTTSDGILINRDLLDEESAHQIQIDPNFSSIAKILLPTPINSLDINRVPSSPDESQQQDCRLAQQLYRQSLEELERETQERIRTFQNEQEQNLVLKTEKLNQELNQVLNLMRSASRHASTAKTSPTSTSSYINENSTESGFGSDIFDIGASDSGRAPSLIDRGFSDRTANSDDDHDEINDDPMLDNRGWSVENSNLSNFATSLPKTIAMRPPSSAYTISQTGNSDDLERIGQSFRDLSRSMCTDGTELFGDLPSPRLNIRHA